VIPIPRPDEVDADWMTHVLRARGRLATAARVVELEKSTCGTGQLGDSFRFTLRYAPDNAGPPTLVGKFTSQDPTSREFGRSSGYYRSEILFYQELAGHLPVALPTAVHARLGENETDFVLLMEDLAPARQVDQLQGCSAEESARVLGQAAALHAATWRRADLASKAWLGGPVGIFRHVTNTFADVVGGFPALCGDLVAGADLKEAAKLIPRAGAWQRVFSQPQCLWHSDLRADNVLFDAGAGRQPVVLLDWQGVGYGCGAIDVAYWLGTSMSVEQRRMHERDLLDHYRRSLLSHGVRDYSASQCWEDYRLHAIHGLQVGVFGLGAVKRTERGDRMWKVWIERTAAQVRDLESYAVLDAR
jgi:hypothetical protein